MKKIIFTILCLFTYCSSVFGQEIYLDVPDEQIKIGDQFEASVLIDSKESLNAFEGKLMFDQNTFKLVSIFDGNSIIPFWLEKPKEVKGTVAFSGVVPFGCIGERGKFFSVVFEALSPKESEIYFRDMKALKNDGEGGEALLRSIPKSIKVSAQDGVVRKYILKDNIPPLTFTPSVNKSEDVFEGKWYVTFNTVDKQSGINFYEIKESRYRLFSFLKSYEQAENPYVLKDQNLQSNIYIKAVDYEGNERLEIVKPSYIKWQEISTIVLFVALYYIVCRLRKKRRFH